MKTEVHNVFSVNFKIVLGTSGFVEDVSIRFFREEGSRKINLTVVSVGVFFMYF